MDLHADGMGGRPASGCGLGVSRVTQPGPIVSLFPGIGLLDRAFEAEGLSTWRGPDLLWGGDARMCHGSPGWAWGVIGGPGPFLRSIWPVRQLRTF
jgi:hypothetical protein